MMPSNSRLCTESLLRGTLSREKVVKGAVLADEDDGVFDRRCGLLMISDGVDIVTLAQARNTDRHECDQKQAELSRAVAICLGRT